MLPMRGRIFVGLVLVIACGDGETTIGSHSVTSCPDAPSVASCDALPRLAHEPFIDGELECGLALTPMPTNVYTNALPEWAGASYAVAWTPAGLYFFVRVRAARRPTPYDGSRYDFCKDGVHLFVDTDGAFAEPTLYDVPGTRMFAVVAPPTDTEALRFGHTYDSWDQLSPWDERRIVAVPLDEGYAVEGMISAEDMGVDAWTLATGATVGFSISVAYENIEPDPSDSCNKMTEFWLQEASLPSPRGAACFSPHCNTSSFCRARLEEAPRL